MAKEKIQMFDDGSNAFKLLYSELKDSKDITVHKVDADDLLEVFTQANTDSKCYLHYTADNLRAQKEELRKQIEKVERVGFKNLIVLPYEGMDDLTVQFRIGAVKLDTATGRFKIDKDNKVKLVDDIDIDEKPYKTQATRKKSRDFSV